MANLTHLTSEELMEIYQTAHPDQAYEAFTQLYQRYSQRVYNYVQSKVKNSADSDDLLQKVFIKMHESKHQYKDKYKFEQWIFVIARTQVLDFFRANKRYDAKLKKVDQGMDGSPLEADLSIFNQLDASQRELLEMKYIDELSYQEISKIVNKSEVSLRKSLSRMISVLKKGEAL